jgi:hypothetical protein
MFLVTISTKDRGTIELISYQTDSHQAELEALESVRYGISHSIIRSTVQPLSRAL